MFMSAGWERALRRVSLVARFIVCLDVGRLGCGFSAGVFGRLGTVLARNIGELLESGFSGKCR